METPSGRSICPDIVILAASGHVIVVEVKRHANPELRDRAVISQIFDYASSFAALSEQQATEVFGGDESTTWTQVVERLFPDDPTPDELSQVLLGRMQNGELNLVIACDKIPSGLPDVVAGIATQRTLGFDLDLVEVAPFVRESTETAEILFVPSTRLVTEIVSRTAVTVTYQQGDKQPSTTIQTTSLAEIEENITRGGQPGRIPAKRLSKEEFLNDLESVPDHSPQAIAAKQILKSLAECNELAFECRRPSNGGPCYEIKRKRGGETLLYARCSSDRTIVMKKNAAGVNAAGQVGTTCRLHFGKGKPIVTLEELLGHGLPPMVRDDIQAWCATNESNVTTFIKWIKDAAIKG